MRIETPDDDATEAELLEYVENAGNVALDNILMCPALVSDRLHYLTVEELKTRNGYRHLRS